MLLNAHLGVTVAQLVEYRTDNGEIQVRILLAQCGNLGNFILPHFACVFRRRPEPTPVTRTSGYRSPHFNRLSGFMIIEQPRETIDLPIQSL